VRGRQLRRKNGRTPSLNPSHQGRENSSPSLPLERKKITSSPLKGEDRGEGE